MTYISFAYICVFLWEENSSCHPMKFILFAHICVFLWEQNSLCHPMTFLNFMGKVPKRVFCKLWAFGYILLRFWRKIDEVSLPQKLMGPADLHTVCVPQSNAVSLIHTSFLFDSWCIVINLVRHLGINFFFNDRRKLNVW